MKQICLVVMFAVAIVSVQCGNPTNGDLEKRLAEIRGWRGGAQGIGAFYAKLKISEDDLLLMRSDVGISRKYYPNVSYQVLCDSRWFAGDDLRQDVVQAMNAEGTMRDGVEYVDAFLGSVVKPQYQLPAEIVIWYYRKNVDMRRRNVSDDERVSKLTEYVNTKAWEKEGMRVSE